MKIRIRTGNVKKSKKTIEGVKVTERDISGVNVNGVTDQFERGF
jgi:hypothetical protein